MPGPWTPFKLQVESLRPSQARTRLGFGPLAERQKVTEAADRALCVIELMADGASIDRLSEDITIHRATRYGRMSGLLRHIRLISCRIIGCRSVSSPSLVRTNIPPCSLVEP